MVDDATAEAAARERRGSRMVNPEREAELRAKIAAVRAREALAAAPAAAGAASEAAVAADHIALDFDAGAANGACSSDAEQPPAPRVRAGYTAPPPDPDQPHVEERDQKPVVDWVSAPDMAIAQVKKLYARPTFVMQRRNPNVDMWLEDDDPPDGGIHMRNGGVVARVQIPSKAASAKLNTTHTLTKVGSTKVTAGTSAAEIGRLLEERPVLCHFEGGAMHNPKRITFDKCAHTANFY